MLIVTNWECNLSVNGFVIVEARGVIYREKTDIKLEIGRRIYLNSNDYGTIVFGNLVHLLGKTDCVLGVLLPRHARRHARQQDEGDEER